jgi:hypothetical protein
MISRLDIPGSRNVAAEPLNMVNLQFPLREDTWFYYTRKIRSGLYTKFYIKKITIPLND